MISPLGEGESIFAFDKAGVFGRRSDGMKGLPLTAGTAGEGRPYSTCIKISAIRKTDFTTGIT
jgi:hypothetical protein